jgi:hypothetical protein
MKDARVRQIVCRDARHALPRGPIDLATTPQTAVPEPDDVVAEGGQTRIVGGHRVVLEIATDYLTQPPPLHGDRFMHTPLQFPFQGTQLGAHPITARLAMKQEEAPTRATTDVREPQEVERLRFAKTALFSVIGRMATELKQTRLLRMQR